MAEIEPEIPFEEIQDEEGGRRVVIGITTPVPNLDYGAPEPKDPSSPTTDENH